jgi:hypothetical protein
VTITWKYHCSVCGQLVHPANLSAHLAEEKAKPNWPGHLTWTRVNDAREKA